MDQKERMAAFIRDSLGTSFSMTPETEGISEQVVAQVESFLRGIAEREPTTRMPSVRYDEETAILSLDDLTSEMRRRLADFGFAPGDPGGPYVVDPWPEDV